MRVIKTEATHVWVIDYKLIDVAIICHLYELDGGEPVDVAITHAMQFYPDANADMSHHTRCGNEVQVMVCFDQPEGSDIMKASLFDDNDEYVGRGVTTPLPVIIELLFLR